MHDLLLEWEYMGLVKRYMWHAEFTLDQLFPVARFHLKRAPTSSSGKFEYSYNNMIVLKGVYLLLFENTYNSKL